MDKDYVVEFVGDYFTMYVNVNSDSGDEDVIVDLASNIIKHHYGWCVDLFAHDVKAASSIEISVKEGWGANA